MFTVLVSVYECTVSTGVYNAITLGAHLGKFHLVAQSEMVGRGKEVSLYDKGIFIRSDQWS